MPKRLQRDSDEEHEDAGSPEGENSDSGDEPSTSLGKKGSAVSISILVQEYVFEYDNV
jgi:hypothetical protein